jgi:hypothetical protein
MSIGNMNPPVPTNGGTVYGGLGRLTVDATKVAQGSTVSVQSIAGETIISAPVGSIIQGKVLAGQICVAGTPSSSGVGASLSTTVTTPASAAASAWPSPITIDVHQLAGQVVVNGRECHR